MIIFTSSCSLAYPRVLYENITGILMQPYHCFSSLEKDHFYLYMNNNEYEKYKHEITDYCIFLERSFTDNTLTLWQVSIPFILLWSSRISLIVSHTDQINPLSYFKPQLYSFLQWSIIVMMDYILLNLVTFALTFPSKFTSFMTFEAALVSNLMLMVLWSQEAAIFLFCNQNTNLFYFPLKMGKLCGLHLLTEKRNLEKNIIIVMNSNIFVDILWHSYFSFLYPRADLYFLFCALLSHPQYYYFLWKFCFCSDTYAIIYLRGIIRFFFPPFVSAADSMNFCEIPIYVISCPSAFE